jgi:hypothetical protein
MSDTPITDAAYLRAGRRVDDQLAELDKTCRNLERAASGKEDGPVWVEVTELFGLLIGEEDADGLHCCSSLDRLRESKPHVPVGDSSFRDFSLGDFSLGDFSLCCGVGCGLPCGVGCWTLAGDLRVSNNCEQNSLAQIIAAIDKHGEGRSMMHPRLSMAISNGRDAINP